MSALTTQMMLSSMLGYIALGAAIAAFMPAVITNAVNRRSQTGPGFLAVWLLADIANLVGIILLGAAVTQVALAAWYFIIDGIMLVQLLFYGHDDLRRYGRPPRKASALARIHERGHLGQSLTRQFEEFSPWDDVKLLGFCVAGGIAAWGIYMTLGLYANPETFAIKIPEGFHPLSFDLLAELPFILGAVLPIIFDAAMLFAIQSWHRRWERSKTRAARDEEKEANQELDLLDEERRCVVALMKLEELEQTVTAKRDKLKHLDDSTEAKEKHELNVELEHLQRDILVNQTALQKLENKIRERFDAAIIMRCWFNKPHLLPSAYSNWILRLAGMDPNVLQLLRYAWEGRFVYGQKADADVLTVCENAATRAGLPLSAMDPSQIRRIDCSVVHHSIGGGTCEQNALKRWIWAFLDALAIYLPVHAIPPLLFNFRRVLSQPGMSAKRILQAACRSSAFLATFVASIYAAVCLVRTRLPQAIASIPQQPLDGGLAVQLGCLVCGLSVLIENKHRRKEMALYTAPRALYALLDETFPASLLSSPLGQQVGTWLERLVFSLSSGAVLTAAVHRPDLVSGVVRGVTSFAVGSWGKPDSR
ncbi:hypothetical protein C6P46_005475 [Rhodotorula mucilaginosa]|uniref:Uncharacterized protein n=1 Tax=Rhodotorula mucilaginosa TaxID=5537 RepID=A0A9P6W8U4_RHOMI|nr:hypothetical protein C6P46_005475 [Rhodotorula mucilaginosa]